MSDVDQADFRRAAGQFPGGIVVVTTRAGHAMTVSAFASVSLEPPLVLFCAEKIARFHDAVLDAGAWAVSILAEDAEKTATWLATRGRPLEGQLDELPHHPGPATGTDPAVWLYWKLPISPCTAPHRNSTPYTPTETGHCGSRLRVVPFMPAGTAMPAGYCANRSVSRPPGPADPPEPAEPAGPRGPASSV